MIERLDIAARREVRPRLLAQDVYVICSDGLRSMRPEHTELHPEEIYLTAEKMVQELLSLPDMEEGIDYEMDDLVEMVDNETDALLVMLVVVALLQAYSMVHTGVDVRPTIMKIMLRWQDHEQYWPLLDSFTQKEEKRWLEGKRTNLLKHELVKIEEEGGGSDEIRKFLTELVEIMDMLDKDSIKDLLLVLYIYNNNHGHQYDAEIHLLLEKLKAKSQVLYQQFVKEQKNEGCQQFLGEMHDPKFYSNGQQ